MERELENDMSKQAYLGRIAEMAVRLATIRAAGRSGPSGSGRPVGYGMGCRRRGHGHHQHDASGRRIAWPQRCAASSPRSSFEIIRQHGTITRRKLQQRIRGRYRTQEMNDMLTQAIEAGLIVRTPNGYAAGKLELGN